MVVGLGIGLFAVAAFGLFTSLHPMRYVSLQTPTDLGWEYEPVSFLTRDGLTLRGWYIPRSGGSATQSVVIVLHGYPFSKGHMLGTIRELHERHDVLLFDFRYFGDSDGSMTTLGFQEHQDVQAAVEYLSGRETGPIGVWGTSLGAAVALLALPHTDGIRAVVADSPYSDLHSMSMDYYFSKPVFSPIMAAFTDLLSRVFIGVSTRAVSPADAVRGTRVPILLIHGSADSTIPADHFHRMRDALAGSPQAEFWMVEDAEHGLAHVREPDTYQSRVMDFFERHLR
ncbi:MAG: menH 2 [Chloroflexi bacterium]|nr:menH 2 [Chloroflexota bacterium]